MLRRVFIILCLLLLAAASGGVWYVEKKGFTKKWRTYVTDELRERGIDVSMRRLTWKPFRGLVAKEVEVFDTRTPGERQVLAVIDEMRVVLNFANLARGKTAIDSLELRDATLSIPVDSSGAKVEISGLRGRLFLPPQQIYLSDFEAEVFGIHVTAAGRLVNPQAFRPQMREPEPPKPGQRSPLEVVMAELGALAFENHPPRLDVRFQGDLARPESMVVNVALRAEGVRRGFYRVRSLALDAEYRDGVATLRQLAVQDDLGQLRASGRYRLDSRELSGQVRSSLDVQALARSLGVAAQLGGFVFQEPPSLEIDVDAHLNEPPVFHVRGHAELRRFSHGVAAFSGAGADFAWDGQRLYVRDLRLESAGRRLSGDVLWENMPARFRARVQSTLHPLDVAPFLKGDAARWASRLDFLDAPQITAEIDGEDPTRPETLKLSGSLRVSRGAESLAASVGWSQAGFVARVKSDLNPMHFAPLFEGAAAEWFAQFAFPDAPEFDIEASGADFAKPEGITARGTVKLGRTSYRDVPAESATANLRYAAQKLHVEDMHVRRAEGTGTGTLIFDFPRTEVTVRDVRTTLHPAEVAVWVDRKIVKDITPYRFGRKPPSARVDGIVHQRDGPTTRLAIAIDALGGMDYTFLRKNLQLGPTSANLLFTPGRLKISDFNGMLLGGRVRGGAEISLRKGEPGHTVELRLENTDFAALTKLYFNFDDSKGRLNATYNFTGKGDDARTMRGYGTATVTDGKVFAIPFLGPLSTLLNAVVPGMGEDTARKASASFFVDGGVIECKDFLVDATAFKLSGGGKLYYLDDRMNADVRVNARGLPGVILFPVSKLLEYTATDKLSEPNWRLKVVPRL